MISILGAKVAMGAVVLRALVDAVEAKVVASSIHAYLVEPTKVCLGRWLGVYPRSGEI